MRLRALGLAAALAATGLAAAPASATTCLSDRPPLNRVCVYDRCVYYPDTGQIRCY